MRHDEHADIHTNQLQHLRYGDDPVGLVTPFLLKLLVAMFLGFCINMFKITDNTVGLSHHFC